MKPITLSALLLCLLLPAAHAQQTIVDQFEERSHTFEGFTLPYRLFVPEDYDPTEAYPLVLALHGAGERGTDNESHIVPHRLATSWADPVNQAEYPTFVVAPQVPPNLRWSAEQPVEQSDITAVQLTTLAILDSLAAEFNLDPDRIYITGLSMGGHGTWDFISRLPGRFAAAVPMSGRADPTQAEEILHIPIWAFHGETDTVVPASGSRRIVQAMEDLGRNVLYTACRRSPPLATNYDCFGSIPSDSLAAAIEAHADLILTSQPNVGHGPWSVWYDHPLLFDWVFAQFRRDPDAIGVTAPMLGTVWTGTAEVAWTAPGPTTDAVEIWLSLDNGATWAQVGEAALGDGVFALDTSAYPDTPFARLRLFILNDRGFVYGRTTTEPFVFDNAGDAPPVLTVDDEALRFDPVVTEESLDLTVLAADPEGEPLALSVFYSTNGGATYAQVETLGLPSSQEAQTITLDVGALPNSLSARFRLEASDGAHAVSTTTVPFEKETPREPAVPVEQVQGEGVGTVTPHFIDPGALTGHRYRVTIDDTDPEAKTYDVTDLDLGTVALTDIPLSDGVLESPVFDGMALVVQDLEEGMPNLNATGWIIGDTDLGVAISGGTVLIAILTVELLATENDYELTMTDAVAGTSVAWYGIPAQDFFFTVTSRSDGLPREVIFADENDDGEPGDGDVLYILEEDPDGALQPAWRLSFDATAETVLPEPSDVFLFVPLRSLSSDDVFEFEAVPVGSEATPTEEATALASYPNPFSDAVTVTVEMATASDVTLDVFDVLGRRVAVLVDRTLDGGTHAIRWTGETAHGARFASGLLVLRLTLRPLDGTPEQTVHRSIVRVH